MSSSVIVEAQPNCISISQAGADLKYLQVLGLCRFSKESNCGLPHQI